MGQWFMSNILQGKEEYFTLIQKYSHYQPAGRMIEYNQIKGKGGERAVSEYVLELKGITKIFPGVKALNNVQFQLKPGEVHALMGENGAGKSTFIKVITGVHKAEEGEMFLNGQKVDFKGPKDAQEAGIAAVYQHPTSYPHLTVAENIFMGHEIIKHHMIQWKEMNQEANKYLGELDADFDATAEMGTLSVAQQQMVEIAKALSTNAIFNIFFCLMLIVFAASFFGAFELTLPSKWSNAVDSKAEQTSGLLSIFLMAFTLSLVSFSCTGPIIGFLLVEVSTTGSVVAPAIGMLGFALALALPFTLFAMFPSWLKSMPKSGGWMNVIKVVLGFLELAFALKFLSVADLAYGWGILDRETFLALWIVIFALLGFYLLGKIKFPHDDDDDKVGVARFFMALISLAFAVYMVPGLWGAPLKAVSAFAPPMNTQDFNLYTNEVHAQFDDYDAGMEYAKRTGKPVMLDFTGYGCVNCRKMEAAVWTDPKVNKLMTEDYVLITLFVDNKTPLPEHIKVMENGKERTLRTIGDKWSYLQRSKFGANAQPFYVLIDNEGKPLNKSYSYDEDIDKYVDFLQTGLQNYKK